MLQWHATTWAAQKMSWPSAQSFKGLDVVSMDNVITLPRVYQGIHKQNFSCGSLSAESTIPKQIHGQLPSYHEMLLCRVWNMNKFKPSYVELRDCYCPFQCIHWFKDSSSCLTFLRDVNKSQTQTDEQF